MKTQADCWRALLNGKTLEDEDFNMVRLENGCQVDESGKVYNTAGFRFCYPAEWKIQREHFDIKKAVELLKSKGGSVTREAWDNALLKLECNFALWVKVTHDNESSSMNALRYEDILADDYYIMEENEDD
jgi:hypothetical protein